MSGPLPFTRFVPVERPLSFSRLRPTRTSRFNLPLPVILTLVGVGVLSASAPTLLSIPRDAEPAASVSDIAAVGHPQDSRVAAIRAATDTSRPDWLGRPATAAPTPADAPPGPEIVATLPPVAKGKDEAATRERRQRLAARIEAAASVTSSIPTGPAAKPAPAKAPVHTISPSPGKPREMKPRDVISDEVKPPRDVRPRAARLRKIRIREATPAEAERPSLAERLFGRRASLFKPAEPDTNR